MWDENVAVSSSIGDMVCRQLGGLTPEQALEIMSAPEILAPALERRTGDIAAARAWMHRYVVLPAFQSESAHGR